ISLKNNAQAGLSQGSTSIDFPRFSEQCEKFFRYILFCRNVTAVLLPSKKREYLCSVCCS
ncbi:MAG: hypothetical protein LIO91_02565, partial [Bacteroidales bacterium]|nr:hypothetical protein [Bacteroidales bacterium]